MSSGRLLGKALLAAIVGMLCLASASLGLILWEELAGRHAARLAEKGAFFAREGDRLVTASVNLVRQSFAARKPRGTFRVFVLGSSQAMGTPFVHQHLSLLSALYPNEGGVSTWLRDYLQAAYPDRKVEVINAAAGGKPLAFHYRIFEEVVAVGDPDLVILSDANNERFDEEWRGSVIPDPAALDGTLGALTQRVKDVLARFGARADAVGVPLYVLTVCTNIRDWHPTAAVRSPLDAAANGLFNECRFREALALYAPLETVRDPESLFFIARCYDRLGNYAKAKRFYEKARDGDLAFMRCRTPWNEAIRGLRGLRVSVFDAEAAMCRYAQDGLPGADLFFDYCHYRLKANQLLAKEIALFHADRAGLPPEARARIEAVRLTDPDALELRTLYAMQAVKWFRGGYYGLSRRIARANSELVASKYREAMRNLDTVDYQLGVLRRPPPPTKRAEAPGGERK